MDSSGWRPFHSRMVFGCYARRTWEQVPVSWQAFLEDGGLTTKLMPIVSSTYQTCQSYPKHTYHTHSQFICRNMSSMVCVGVDFADFTGIRFCPLYRSFDVVLSTICIVQYFQYHTFCSYLLSPRQVMIHLGNQGIGATAC